MKMMRMVAALWASSANAWAAPPILASIKPFSSSSRRQGTVSRCTGYTSHRPADEWRAGSSANAWAAPPILAIIEPFSCLSRRQAIISRCLGCTSHSSQDRASVWHIVQTRGIDHFTDCHGQIFVGVSLHMAAKSLSASKLAGKILAAGKFSTSLPTHACRACSIR